MFFKLQFFFIFLFKFVNFKNYISCFFGQKCELPQKNGPFLAVLALIQTDKPTYSQEKYIFNRYNIFISTTSYWIPTLGARNLFQ